MAIPRNPEHDDAQHARAVAVDAFLTACANRAPQEEAADALIDWLFTQGLLTWGEVEVAHIPGDVDGSEDELTVDTDGRVWVTVDRFGYAVRHFLFE